MIDLNHGSGCLYGVAATRPPITEAVSVATRRDAVASALLHRYSPTLFPLEDAARQYRGMTLLELARESLGNAGVNTRGLSRDEVATRALHSTSDFPEILSAVTNKTLRQAYEAYHYQHRAEIEAVVQGTNRDTAFDTLCASVGAALAADRTLGGLCDWVEAEAPQPVDLPVDGAATLKAAVIPVVLHYSTVDPLG